MIPINLFCAESLLLKVCQNFRDSKKVSHIKKKTELSKKNFTSSQKFSKITKFSENLDKLKRSKVKQIDQKSHRNNNNKASFVKTRFGGQLTI